MKKNVKQILATLLISAFSSMQVYATTIQYGDTGLGAGNGGAYINNATGGYVNTELGNNSATLNFNGNAHVEWNSLNVNSGETLNFNAVDGVSGLTILNTVNSGMTNVYGTISSNQGIAKLIISNPNGMLFDGARFTTAGDLLLTTQQVAPLTAIVDIEGGQGTKTVVTGYQFLNGEASNGVVIKDGATFKSNFTIGGEFNIIAPSVEIVGGYIGATKGLNLITRDGQNFLVCPGTSNSDTHKAVRLESVEIDGNVYIVSGEGIVTTVNGGNINGDLTIDSNGRIGLNYTNNDNVLNVTGNLTASADGPQNIVRKANVGGDINMSNSGGYVEIYDVTTGGDVNLVTTPKAGDNTKHFVHVTGYNNIGGDLNIDSINNIHIGGYDTNLVNLIPGELNVAGDINAVAHDGSIAVTVDTTADKVSLTSENLNIVTDGVATITANEYQFDAKQYIGGLMDTNYLIKTVMENYTPIGRYITGDRGYVNIAGGNVTKFHQDDTSYSFLKSNGNMNIDNIDAGKLYVTSNQDIVIGDNAVANTIKVGGETRNLTVELPSRDYTLKYTNIKDNAVITIDGNTEITYEMANGENGWNQGVQTAQNTYLVVPGNTPNNPDVPPVDPNDPSDPTDGDAEKILRNLARDEVASKIDAQQVMTPVAFAADLDDEIDTGVRKNVDGSVTVVRPFTPEG